MISKSLSIHNVVTGETIRSESSLKIFGEEYKLLSEHHNYLGNAMLFVERFIMIRITKFIINQF